MSRVSRSLTDVSGGSNPGDHRLWWATFLGLVAWQAWMTLSLFDPADHWRSLRDDRPVVSGAHPLHLYFGWLGASAWRANGTLCCYDPAFLAGYPKTPVFDSGSRPAELFLTLAGGTYSPAAYKIGLAACCGLVPFLLLLGARGAGLSRAASCLAVALGLLVWWGKPCRDSLEAGDLDLLLGGLSAVACAGRLLAFHRAPGVAAGAGLLLVGTLGWFAHPLLFLLLCPGVLVYYLSVGTRHSLVWHLSLLLIQAGALALNSFWLIDWARSWWLRLPQQLDSTHLAHRTLEAFWNSPLWGEPADRTLAAVLVVLAAVGVVVLNQTNRRPAARVLGLGAGVLLLLASAGISWAPLGRVGTSTLFIPGLWFALVPAVATLAGLAGWLSRTAGSRWLMVVIGAGLAVAAGLGGRPLLAEAARRATGSTPLAVGLSDDQQALVEAIRRHTTPAARILWEERPGAHESSRWTALLPLWTERAYIGGFGPDVCIEHAYAGLVGENLAGRPIAEWSDLELEHFCRRYNVGWVVCWSPAALARFRAWRGATPTAPVQDHGAGYLFTLRPGSYVLKGKAEWLEADWRRIVLGEVIPEDGKVVLSLHYQSGMTVSPSRVEIEREKDAYDPIPFVRLKVPGPVARLTLTWESH